MWPADRPSKSYGGGRLTRVKVPLRLDGLDVDNGRLLGFGRERSRGMRTSMSATAKNHPVGIVVSGV